MNEQELRTSINHIEEIRYMGRFRGIKKNDLLDSLMSIFAEQEHFEGLLVFLGGEFYIELEDKSYIPVYSWSVERFVGWQPFFEDEDEKDDHAE